MTLLDAMRADWFIPLYLSAAGFGIAWVLYHVGLLVRSYWRKKATRRLIRSWRRADERRKSRDVIGDPLIEQIGSLASSADRDNRMRIVYGPWRPRW